MKRRASTNAFGSGQQGLKKLVLSCSIIGTFAFYSVLHARSNATALPTSSAQGVNASGASTTSPSSTSTALPGARFKEGTYTGGEADAQWGYVRVQVVIRGGKIADVKFLEYPNERNRSVMINSYADPVLVSEAIQAQSAQVDIVSGATDSSYAFMQSLADSLSQAQA